MTTEDELTDLNRRLSLITQLYYQVCEKSKRQSEMYAKLTRAVGDHVQDAKVFVTIMKQATDF